MFIHRVVSKSALGPRRWSKQYYCSTVRPYSLREVALLQARDLVQEVDWATHPFATSPRTLHQNFYFASLLFPCFWFSDKFSSWAWSVTGRRRLHQEVSLGIYSYALCLSRSSDPNVITLSHTSFPFPFEIPRERSDSSLRIEHKVQTAKDEIVVIFNLREKRDEELLSEMMKFPITRERAPISASKGPPRPGCGRENSLYGTIQRGSTCTAAVAEKTVKESTEGVFISFLSHPVSRSASIVG